MKKYIVSMLALFIIVLALPACSSPAGAGQSSPLPESASPSQTPSPAPGFVPYTDTSDIEPGTGEYAAYFPDNAAAEDGEGDDYGDDETPPLNYKQPSKDTVIIASSAGGIYGGYSSGEWLTHKEAAAYCGGTLTFCGYNLTGYVGSAESSGVAYDNSDDRISSGTPGGKDEEGGYYFLKASIGLEDEHLPVNYYKVPPQKLPEITAVTDTSAFLPEIQRLVDKNLGKDAATARIAMAVLTDIDNDGRQEAIVNADNCADKVYELGGKNFYSIACIIESDGSVRILQDTYLAENSSDDFSDVEYSCAQNIIDINGDGRCEIVAWWEAWETNCVTVYTYDGLKLKEVLSYETWV